MQNKVFFPQDALDIWLVDGTIELVDGEFTVASSSQKFKVVEAVRVMAEVSGAPDPHELIGKVRAKASLVELGAEILQGSMILSDNAYDISMGWLGQLNHTDEELRTLNELQASLS